MKKVCWFSAGVSSAVACKLSMPVDEIIYIHIDDQHPDSMRFVLDCEKWFGQKITIMQSPAKSVDGAVRLSGVVNTPYGASCTRILKKRVRKEWEIEQTEKLCYVWGFDIEEKNRAERLYLSMPEQEHVFPLIDNKITKEEAHRILNASGIKRPAMYDMGYENNNCIGCIKGGKGYWNKIRKDFPEVFQKRIELEELMGGTCLKDCKLSDLPINAGFLPEEIMDDCGIFCEIMAI